MDDRDTGGFVKIKGQTMQAILKDVLGEPTGQHMRKIGVRYDFVHVEHDVMMAAADNNYLIEMAKATRPEDMTSQKVLEIVRPSFETPKEPLSDPDYAAVCGRMSLMAFVCTTEDRLVCYVTNPRLPPRDPFLAS